MESLTKTLIETLSLILPIVAVLFSALGLIRFGQVRKFKFGNFVIEGDGTTKRDYDDLIKSLRSDSKNDLPFEIEQLAKYYTQILYQTKVSFWFSIIFASLGFSIIVFVIFANQDLASAQSIASFISSAVIEAVSALFFTRSNKAQKEMEEFFNKLRTDRKQAEARRMTDNIEHPLLKDVMKIQLALHYSDIATDSNSVNEAIAKAIGNEGFYNPKAGSEPN
ncbi:hypothetical protein GCM10011506_01680 [Marivirga lumbricoides]|uniref:Cyanobacterial TRADD-N associated 2 transmembrane domain-containing protein n=1 Tax=Marivirga lumbricoides TaxID=1046115 RepID=A0ABQ1L8C4_9BACT|nr:hypothetical protein GCM10011506_01680 [Marivirga lumbricoides]